MDRSQTPKCGLMRAADVGVLPKPPERQKNKDTVYPAERPTMTNILQDTCALLQHHHKLECLRAPVFVAIRILRW